MDRGNPHCKRLNLMCSRQEHIICVKKKSSQTKTKQNLVFMGLFHTGQSLHEDINFRNYLCSWKYNRKPLWILPFIWVGRFLKNIFKYKAGGQEIKYKFRKNYQWSPGNVPTDLKTTTETSSFRAIICSHPLLPISDQRHW